MIAQILKMRLIVIPGGMKWIFTLHDPRLGPDITHENLFHKLYIINMPSIIGIQFIDGVGENIVKLYNPILYIPCLPA